MKKKKTKKKKFYTSTFALSKLPKVISHCTNPAFKGKKIKYILVS